MARLQIPPLEASDGTLAIVYRIASHAYGEWNVTWPQDYDAPELQPGREQGYVSRLPGGEPPPFGRRFVRQDVSIDAVNGESNVERTLDEAADSLSGEVVVEREIGPEGLGNLKLGLDFKKGDLVPVAIATKVLELPVTRATYRDEAGQLTEPTIGVGYSLLVDRSGLAAHNEESERRIAADLRDLAPRLQAVETTARENTEQVDVAKKAASDAKTVAQTANSAASQAQTSADGKSTVFYGDTTPAKAKAGDTWFKDVAGGGTVLMQYVNGEWVEKVNAKAIDDELAANQEALTELNNVTLPGLKDELEALDTEVAREAAAKLATLETKLANADKALKQGLQGEITALDKALSGELTSSLTSLKTELEALDAEVAREAAAKLDTLDRKLRENAVSEVTANQLWANGIAAKSVVTNRILVAGNGNMLPEISSYVGSEYPNPDPYEDFGKNSRDPSMWLKGRVNAYIKQPISIVAGQKYRLRYQAKASVNGTSHYLFIRQGNPDGPTSPSDAITTKVNGNSNESTYLVANGKVGGSWEPFDVTFEPSTTEVAYIYIYANHTNGTDNPNYQWFKDVRLEKMTGATLIEDGAITTGKVASDAITANKIAADQILAKHVKADQIVAKHVKSGEIKAEHLLAEDATIDKLWTNGLVAKSVVTNRILVAGNGNMLPEIATYVAADSKPEIDPYPSPFGVRTDPPSVWLKGRENTIVHHPLNLVAGQKYRFSYRVNATVNGTRHFWQVRSGSVDGYSGTLANVKVGSTTTSYLIRNEVANRADIEYVVEFEPITTGTYYLMVYSNHSKGTTNDDGYQWFRDLRLEKMTGATLIEDGAVTTNKIAADAVTANAIAADAVTANAIKAGEITGRHIEAGSITSREMTIENGFIKNAMIGNGQVNNAKIANLDAGKITAGTIDANRIGAKTITGDHLAVDTIEANQIKANVFTQVASNVIPLYPGTTRPAWTINADYTGTNSSITDGDSRFYKFSGTRAPGSDNLVEVDPDIEYVFSVWITGNTGSVIYVELLDQDGNHAVESGGISSYDRNNATNYLIQNMSLRSGWRKISTKIKLKKEARFVRIGSIYGNHSRGVNGDAYLADMRLYPDVASQAEINAMRKKQADDNRKRIDDNKKRIGEIDALTTELDLRSVGMVTVKADGKARSTTHGVGIWMPGLNKKMDLYLSPSFAGTIAIQVFYGYSLVGNRDGQTFQYFYNHTAFNSRTASGMNSHFRPLAENGKLLHKQITVKDGKVDQAMVFVDHLQWDRG